MSTRVPRLLYLGDVPVEPSYHGSALLYRLLQSVPAEALTVVEGNLYPAATTRRLPGVTHQRLHVGTPRLMNSRLHVPYTRWLLKTAPLRARTVLSQLGEFEPEAVVTVAHGFSWITAARVAQLRGIPLHLIVHDDCPRVVPPALQGLVDGHFRSAYQQAASRLCVSPAMAEEYQRRYGVEGTVLLPSRSGDAPVFEGPAPRASQPDGPPVFAFAGTINTPGYARLLRQLADQLLKHQGKLLLFGPLTHDQAAAAGLVHDAIELCGLLESSVLMTRLRSSVDVLFVPMSFATADESNMRMSFPSKLTDYTAVGVPMLLCGPSYCSAVRWATENPGVAEVVTSDEASALAGSVDRLIRDGRYRLELARQAQLIGARDFAAATAAATFHDALRPVPMTSARPATSLRERVLLGALDLVPAWLARHMMFLLRHHPRIADSWGYHVRPIHYYEPLPDFRAISAEAASRRRPSSIDFDLDSQRRLLTRLGAEYGDEIASLTGFNFANEYFAGADAATYYALIRDLRPARVIEIGAGYSTRIADRALQRNRRDGHPGELTCIEPFPAPRLTDDMPKVTLIKEPVERVPLEVFDQLQANDVLFIDSSHAVKFGGDVCREFLEILPRLQPGVWIHVHDIFFPHDYPVSWLVERRLAWTEQYLLEAFLSFNGSFAPRAALHWMWAEEREVLRGLWPDERQTVDPGPASFWMMRRG